MVEEVIEVVIARCRLELNGTVSLDELRRVAALIDDEDSADEEA